MNVKKKGNKGEHAFAHWLMENGIKAFRNSMSGGSVWKGDIANNLDMSIEVKTVKKLNVMDAWKQVNRDASIAHNQPILAIHYDQMPNKEWLIVMSSTDWIEWLKKEKGITESL
jgi:Holliday junction resolvase